MFFKLQKCFTILKKLFLIETEMQILTETQIPPDLTMWVTPPAQLITPPPSPLNHR